MREFETKLYDKGYNLKLLLNETCPKKHNIRDVKKDVYYIYYQQCSCCLINPREKVRSMKEIEFPWYRQGPYCQSCFDSTYGILFCGGHYSNIRYFKDNIDISDHELDLEPESLLVDSVDSSNES